MVNLKQSLYLRLNIGYDCKSPRKRNGQTNHPDTEPIAVLGRKEMQPVSVEVPPLPFRAEAVIPDRVHVNFVLLTVDLDRSGQLAVLLVVGLVVALQVFEVLPAPLLVRHRFGHRPRVHVTIEVEDGQIRRPGSF